MNGFITAVLWMVIWTALLTSCMQPPKSGPMGDGSETLQQFGLFNVSRDDRITISQPKQGPRVKVTKDRVTIDMSSK